MYLCCSSLPLFNLVLNLIYPLSSTILSSSSNKVSFATLFLPSLYLKESHNIKASLKEDKFRQSVNFTLRLRIGASISNYLKFHLKKHKSLF